MAKPTLAEVKSALSAKYVHMESTIETLHQALTEGHNVILYGPPGHGKSEITKDFLELIYPKEEIFKTQFGVGTALDQILGYIDVKKYFDTGVQEYNLDVSFLAHKAAIFEEMFNARPKILQTLIDILMSKEYCVGGANKVCYKQQTEIIVACTNVDPSAWAKNATDDQTNVYKAFNERFVFRNIVEWPSYTREDYQQMFSKVFGSTDSKMTAFAEMAAFAASEGKMITPRTAIKAVKSYKEYGVKGLAAYGDIDASLFSQFSRIDADAVRLQRIMTQLGEGKTLIRELSTPTNDLKSIATRYKSVTKLYEDLNNANCPSYSDIVLEVSTMVNTLREAKTMLEQALIQKALSA